MHFRKGFRIGMLPLVAMLTGAASPAPLPARDPMASVVAGLVDQDGRTVTVDRFAGRYVLVNFIFTACGSTCPMQTADLVRFERSLPAPLRNRITLLSISVDPAHDTPGKLKAYAETFGVDGHRWTFATGRVSDLARITRDFSALRPGQTGSSVHVSEVHLFDRRHRMIQRYNGAPLAARQLRSDLSAIAAGQS